MTSIRSCNTIEFDLRDQEKTTQSTVVIDRLTLAGYTGRNPKKVEQHIAELEDIRVPRPRSTPSFYSIPTRLLTTASKIQVNRNYTSGEVEGVLFSLPNGLHLGVGSDHTDRKLERFNIALSKQVCAKPIGSELWHIDNISSHWDELVLRSFVVNGKERELYQEGSLVEILKPQDLIERYIEQGEKLTVGSVLFCGTIPTRGQVNYANEFAIELFDPVLNRKISHQYKIEVAAQVKREI